MKENSFLSYLSVGALFEQIFCIIVIFSNFGISSNVSKRRDGKNLPITKVSIRRNFCVMAVQTDCHFQMFRTRYIYIERKRDRMKENERVRMYGIFKNFVKKLYARVVTIETSF